MNCKKCNASVTELDLYCPNCGEPVENGAVPESAPAATVGGMSRVIASSFKSSLFIVYAVFASFVGVFSLIGAFVSSDIDTVIGLITAAFSIVTAAFAWKIWASAPDLKASDVKMLAVYPVFMKIYSAMLCILAGIVSFLVLLVSVVCGLVMMGVKDANDIVNEAIVAAGLGADASVQIESLLENSGWVIAVSGAVAVVIVMFIFINVVRLYGKAADHFKKLSACCAGGEYNADMKVPHKRLWVFGVLFAIAGLASFAGSGAISAAESYVGALSLLSEAGLLITTALFFTSISKSVKAYVNDPSVCACDKSTETSGETSGETSEETVTDEITESETSESTGSGEESTESDEENGSDTAGEDAFDEMNDTDTEASDEEDEVKEESADDEALTTSTES